MEFLVPLLVAFMLGIFFIVCLFLFEKNYSLRETKMEFPVSPRRSKIIYPRSSCLCCTNKKKEETEKVAKQTKVKWYREGEAILDGAKYLDRKVVDELGSMVEYFLFEIKE